MSGGGMRLGDDDRFDLASMADAARRRNRPAALPMLASALLVIALGAVGLAKLREMSIGREIELERAALERIAATVDQIGAVEARREGSTDRPLPPLSDMVSRIERYAEETGIARPAFPRRNESPLRVGQREIEGVRLREWSYSVTDGSLAELMAWVSRCLSNIPGLFVREVELTPRADGWQIRIVYARTETTGGEG